MFSKTSGNPGQVPSVKHPFVLFSPSNWILSCFCPCLASCVRVNFLYLFLCCSTLLFMWDELNINKWHMINHALFCLTACVKWHSGSVTNKFLVSIKFFCFVLFLYACVFLFHQGPGFSFTSVVTLLPHQIHRHENVWERGSNNTRLPRNNNQRGALMQGFYCFRRWQVNYFWVKLSNWGL